jgi:hypothetical protein
MRFAALFRPYRAETLVPSLAAEEVLTTLPKGARVAVATLLGSLCPITLGHVQGFVEARALFLGEAKHPGPRGLEKFDHFLGYISLNGNGHVSRKLQQKGEPSIGLDARRALVELAISELDYVGLEESEGMRCCELAKQFPHLQFVHFFMNGADDVLRYQKWRMASPQFRFITMGRKGDTEKVVERASHAGVDLDAGHFVMGAELPDVSSTDARLALMRGDSASAARILNPAVLRWCEEHGPWQPEAGPTEPTTQEPPSVHDVV